MKRLEPHIERVTYKLSDSIIKPNRPMTHVVFPETCLASLVIVLESGSTVEAASVGREGMAGIPPLMAVGTTPMQTVIQVPGDAIRIPIPPVKELFDQKSTFHSLILRYAHTLFVAASQSAACNRKHQVHERLARWLLASSDGIGRDDVNITHEFLATMLGVRRSGVTEGMAALESSKLIETKRGAIRIVDRPGMQRASCECYRSITNEFERLFA